MDPLVARKTWRTLEPLHGLIYFTPEVAEEYAAVGLPDSSGYFAFRAAPMGPVAGEVVVATFFNFSPTLVRAAIPSAWDVAAPEVLVAARLRAADRALIRILGASAGGSDVARAADLARVAADAACEHTAGRALFAGHATLPWPDEPHLVLWHAQTLLREFRGDGHVSVLTAEGLGPVEALVIHAATGDVPASVLRSTRGWDDLSWEAGVESVRRRGWLEPGDALALNDAGRSHRQTVEDRTDLLAVAAYAALGDERCAELRALARPLSKSVVDGGALGVSPPGGARAPG